MIALIAAALASVPDHEALATASWEPVTTRGTDIGTVSLSKATIDGVRCVRGEVDTQAADIAALHAVTDRMVTSPDWSEATVSHSEELARDDHGFVLHQHFDSPGWTLTADRYWVIRGAPELLDANTARYRWHRVDAAEWPEAQATSTALASRAVEMPVNYGEWTFHDTGEHVTVDYAACADIGGGAPEALVSWITTRQIPTLIEELVTEAQRAGSAPSAADAPHQTHATAQQAPQ